ncbi:ROK family protein [Ruegeria sp. TM1040]|jgi:glucokinase|uniref:glucokinase n=1 Tax=Rhodobacterales TaxID=204455 RepID=UPI0000462855|nr:ROK family protein [Ruegeria sp. TM1040]ABF63096.1 glucokinase [Ruegeria sp. TM1040]MDF9304609.1 ROK family protein [Tritonibacter mobilis]
MWNLIADVGGTNMRLAAVNAEGEILEQARYDSKGTQNLEEACADFAAHRGSAPGRAVIAAAGVVRGGSVQLTNANQSFSERGIAVALQTERVKVLNDFEAAAWSLASVSAGDVTVLQGQAVFPKEPCLIIGPGTGLGVGALIWANGEPCVVPGEGGHVAIGPRTADEVAIFEALREEWPEIGMGPGLAVEAEGILSGTGLPYFYRAVARSMELTAPLTTGAEIFQSAQARLDTAAVRAVSLFAQYLAGVAGDLGLVFAAKGGVFVTGGVAAANPWIFDAAFVEAFNAGGRHTAWREELPLHLYHQPNFGLIGARNYLRAR